MKRTSVQIIFATVALLSLSMAVTDCTQAKAKKRKVSDVVRLLREAGNDPVILQGEDQNKVVVVTPELVGRVLCTGLDGIEGYTDCYIDEGQIKKGAAQSERAGKWSSFGGEERIWLVPEGGEYGLYYQQGEAQEFQNHMVPESLNSTRYQVTGKSEDGGSVTFKAPLQLVNYQGTNFDLEIVRKVQILESCPYALGFGHKIESVGFETNTWVRNVGDKPLTRESGAIGVWTLGQFPAKDHSVIIVPFRSGPDSLLGPVLNTEYFKTDMIDTTKAPRGHTYGDYWEVKEDFALVKANGSVMTKIEMGPKRSLGRLASVDLQEFEMTIVEFRMYPELDYVASYWLPYDANPYDGAAISVFVLSKEAGVPPFYELEVISPALFLQPGEQYQHISRTYHLRGDRDTIAQICQRHLNADLETLQEFDRNAP